MQDLSRPKAIFASAAFTFATLSPLDFGALGTGDEITLSDVVIDTIFDDPTAIVTLGLASSTGSILPSSAVDPAAINTYSTGQVFTAVGSDALRVQIVPGASTTGSGRAIVTIRRA